MNFRWLLSLVTWAAIAALLGGALAGTVLGI